MFFSFNFIAIKLAVESIQSMHELARIECDQTHKPILMALMQSIISYVSLL